MVFPELLTADIIKITDLQSEAEAMRALSGNFFDIYKTWLMAKADEYEMAILGGSTPRQHQGEILNTSLLVFPGQKIYMQDKLFLTPSEKDWGFVGGQQLQVMDTPLGKIVILICFDCEMPLLSQMLAEQQPELILVPSWTSTLQGFHRVLWTAQARAIEHFAYVVKTSTVADTENAEEHFGQAAIIPPQDLDFNETLQQGLFNQEDFIWGKIDLEKLSSQRTATGYYPAQEQQTYNETRDIKINQQ